jgi:rod shape-determining protein RodA
MLDTVKQYLRYTSWPIIAAMVGLIVIGVLAINVSEQAQATARVVAHGFAQKQMLFGAIAIGAFLVMTVFPYQRVGEMAYPLFALTLVVLVAMFFLPKVHDTYRWIDAGLFQIQPSEIAKITYIAMVAWYLRTGENYRRLSGFAVPLVLTFVPMILILKEPDLGTSLLFLPTLYFMLFMAGAKIRHLLGVIAIATAFIFVPIPQKISPHWSKNETDCRQRIAYCQFQRDGENYLLTAAALAKMEPHQISRIAGWLNQNDPAFIRGNCYQLHQSIVIIGSGGMSGRSDWADNDYFFHTLPEDHTDFIFGIIGGQWGFLGCLGVLLLYMVIFVLGLEIASITTDSFGRMLAVGVLTMLFSQVVINVCMTMGMMPVTGVPLPLVSYGGSSLVMTCGALGLLINVGQRRPMQLGKLPFEFGHREKGPHLPNMADRK